MQYPQEPMALEPIELNDAELAAVSGGLLNFRNSLNNFGNISNSTAHASGIGSVALIFNLVL
jgi:bacteriocin-like protein